jgi:hypothetical protein
MAATARPKSILSAITGIPSGRRSPLLLGTYTRLTGRGDHAAAPCWTQVARSAFSWASKTTVRSTPAVLRPALASVTRRTLTRALLRDRSISFCRLRTLARSPACDAAKIRCLSRRTSRSAWPQFTQSQSSKSSSGPFTSRAFIASACPLIGVQLVLRFGRPDVISPQAHQTRVSTLSGRGTSPYPASYAGTAGGGASIWSRFPAAFRPPAFASRVFLRPLRDSAFLAVGLPGRKSCRTPSGLSRSACDRYDRGGCPLNPGDGGALPTGQIPPIGTRRLSTAGPYLPLEQPINGSANDEASSRIHSRSPVRPSPARNPRMERGSFGLSPGFAPHSYP